MTLIENILALHSGKDKVIPGEIVDILIDVRIARDFGGANVVKHIEENQLEIADRNSTFFTFDCNPTGSDQSYAANQQLCRVFARKNGIRVFDINAGIGTHLAMDKALVLPGSTLVSTDSHANIVGAIGAFGQGMGDREIAAAWTRGKIWFKVPPTVKIVLDGKRPEWLMAKDIALNLLRKFGANELLGYAIEITGEEADKLSLDERITISSMATEMGAIIILFEPKMAVIRHFEDIAGKPLSSLSASKDASYEKTFKLDISEFQQLISMPGHPEATVPLAENEGIKIDSAFIGSCTNGRMEDMKAAAKILTGRKVAPGVVLKIVPATDEIWNQCLKEGIIDVFKVAGVLVGNAGCAGCASGQIGQNGPGEVTISTGNRNFYGKQGKGEVYLASPEVVSASAVAGHITSADKIPAKPSVFKIQEAGRQVNSSKEEFPDLHDLIIEGNVWLIEQDNIDTDMIFHNQHLTIIDIGKMGQFTFGNLKGFEHFANTAAKGDIVIAGKNFGAGSSRQQAVDCFKSLGIQAVLAKSFGAIYERNAINAGFPVLTYSDFSEIELKNSDRVRIDLQNGIITNLNNSKAQKINSFSAIQMKIYLKGDLLRV